MMSDIDWAALDESPAATAQMLQWHAPKTYTLIREQIANNIESLADGMPQGVYANYDKGLRRAARIARGEVA
jgi:hypothetical protein